MASFESFLKQAANSGKEKETLIFYRPIQMVIFPTRLAVIREKSKVQVPEEDHLRECRGVLLPLLPLGSRGLPAGVGRGRRRLPPQGDEDAVGPAAAADAAGRGRAPVGVGGGRGGGLDGGGVAVGAEPLELLVGGGEVLAAGVTRVLLAKF